MGCQPADNDRCHGGQSTRTNDRIAHEKGDDQDDDRKEEKYLFDHLVKARQLVFSHAAHTKLGGFEINHEIDRNEIKDGWNNSGNRDLGIGNTGDLGHDEGTCPHDRRHDLPAG